MPEKLSPLAAVGLLRHIVAYRSVLFKVLGFGLKKTRLKKNYFRLKKKLRKSKIIKNNYFLLKKNSEISNFGLKINMFSYF